MAKKTSSSRGKPRVKHRHAHTRSRVKRRSRRSKETRQSGGDSQLIHQLRPGFAYGKRNFYKHLVTEAFDRSLKHLEPSAGKVFFKGMKKNLVYVIIYLIF